MSATSAEQRPDGRPSDGPLTHPDVSEQALRAGLVAFAAIHLGLALLMATAPHTFYKDVGPFEAFNPHYIRDVSTFYAALGAGAAVAVRRPSWRVPVLAMTAVEYGLHSLNHLFDIGRAHPTWIGYFDFATLAAATLLLAWLLRLATAEPAALPTPHLKGGS
jgi:hypothetical protein